MPVLILVNGPPAAGKSTLAGRLVAERPLALNLDIDAIRSLLGGWLDRPGPSGRAARELALAMARTHLTAGLDVVIPQYLGRPDLIERLEALAGEVDATFVELVLRRDRDEVEAAFVERSRQGLSQAHREAAELVARSTSPDPLGELYDRLETLLEHRPLARSVEVVVGDVDATMTALRRTLAEAGVVW